MPELTLHQALDLAHQHRQSGRLPQAQQIADQILAQRPNHPDALHLLSLIALQLNQPDTALHLIRQILAQYPTNPAYHATLGDILLKQGHLEQALLSLHQTASLLPNSPEAHYNLANAYRRQGRIDQAILFYQKSLALNPNFVLALNNLGNIFKEQNHLDQALACFENAVRSDPNFFPAHNNLGVAYREQGRLEEAVASFQKALSLNPNQHEAHNNLGVILKEKNQLEAAIASFQKALAVNPDYPEALSNLAVAYKAQRRFDEALSTLHRALALNPNYADAHNNLGSTLYELDRFDEALTSYRQALTLNPNHFEATNNLGNTLREQGQVETALTLTNQSLALNPNFPLAHFNRAVILLLQGHLEEGWQEYEWRWQWKDFPSLLRPFTQPLFFDQDPAGKTILLHTEQGLGDAIQFARYIPLLAQRGAKIIIECHPQLRQLFQTLPGISSIHNHHDPLPPYDLQAPFLSLPRAFHTTLNTIPTNIPYLKADPQKILHWKNYLATHTKPHTKKIGLVWSGNPSHRADHRRSIPLSTFAPLFNLPNIQFISLQKGPAASQLSPSNFPLLNPTDQLPDFTDTAALLSSLDLLITVDTAVAHLAGALALPVWTLLPFAPDWRWLQNRTDSPWYPTMKLFRQPAPADWPSVIQSLAQALTHSNIPAPH